jgi:hypothetical protein
MQDKHEAFCQKCGIKMERVFYPAYLTGDLPQTKGTVCGYDESLGVELRGRAHREAIMRERGLAEFVPDPQMQAYREEIKYVEKHAPGRDGRAAVARLRSEMGTKRRERNVKRVVDAAFKQQKEG